MYYLKQITPQRILSLWAEHKHVLMMGLFLLQLIAVYGLIQVFISSGLVPQTRWDQPIPLVPTFIIPYVLYYPLLVVPFWMAYKQDSNEDLFAAATTFFVAATICNLIFILYPTTINRPPVPGDGMLAEAVRLLHAYDGSKALLPSGHVTYGLLANLVTWHGNKTLAYILLPVTLLIMPATVLIKQHYILDIFAGIVVASGVYWFVFRRAFRY
jgi:membrane-associated phospholipid phosphatase